MAVCCFDMQSFPGEGWQERTYCLSEAAKKINRKAAAALKKSGTSSLEGTLWERKPLRNTSEKLSLPAVMLK